MATTVTILRDQVKDFASVPAANTNYDADIANYVAYAIKLLAPIALQELPANTTKTVNSDGRTIDLPATILQVRDLELYATDLADYSGFNDFKQHGSQILLDYYVSPGTQVRIWGLGYYAQDATTLPVELEIVIVYWALSMLYSSFAGDKRKYDIYVGSTGAAGDRDMKDSSTFYKNEGDQLLLDRVAVRGS